MTLYVRTLYFCTGCNAQVAEDDMVHIALQPYCLDCWDAYHDRLIEERGTG